MEELTGQFSYYICTGVLLHFAGSQKAWKVYLSFEETVTQPAISRWLTTSLLNSCNWQPTHKAAALTSIQSHTNGMSAMNIITNWPWTIDQQSETMREFQSCWSCCNSHIWRSTNCAVLVLKTILSKNPSLFPQAPQTWVNLAQQSHRNAICSYVSR